MTAFDSYFEYIGQGRLPATVPVVSKNGEFRGIATGGIDFTLTKEAFSMVMSDDPKKRAYAAICAIRHMIEQLPNHDETLEPQIR